MEEFEGLTVSPRPSIDRIGSYPTIRTALARQLPMSHVIPHTYLQQRENEKRLVFNRICVEVKIQTGGKGTHYEENPV
jgi:hypothetical protein